MTELRQWMASALAGRRTYADAVAGAFTDRSIPYHFGDAQAKLGVIPAEAAVPPPWVLSIGSPRPY